MFTCLVSPTCLLHVSLSYFKSHVSPSGNRSISMRQELALALQAFLTHTTCCIDVPLCSDNFKNEFFRLWLHFSRKSSVTHILCVMVTQDVTSCVKCQAELLAGMRVLERSIVCSGSLSFMNALAWPRHTGLGTAWSSKLDAFLP